MRLRRLTQIFARLALALGLPLALLVSACSAQVDEARAAHRKGEYSQAIDIYARAIAKTPTDAAIRRDHARALMETGRYDEAATTLSSAPVELQPHLANTLGEALRAQGKLAEAAAAFQTGQRGSDSLGAKLNLAIAAYDRGDKAAAMPMFDRFIDVYNNGKGKLTSSDLAAIATAVKYLGDNDPQLFKDALKAYDEAIAADPNNDDARIALAELWLEKFVGDEAQTTIGQVLEHNPNHPRALLFMARAKEFEGSPEAVELAKKALEINPKLIAARVFAARGALLAEDFALARDLALKTVEQNPSSLDALTILATAYYLLGDRGQLEDIEKRVLALNPRYAELYSTLAEMSVQTRQYPRAIELGQRAVALDSTSWAAHGALGINLMRVGRLPEGRKHIEIAFKGDPYNVWFKNTLDLLDSMDRYRTTETDRFTIVADPREAELLEPYILALGNEAYAKLSQRYKTNLQGKIRLELFSSHADFSVRTVGLAGLGALGASFGNVLTMDSPSAREAGQFNWGSTMWHEMAHAFHLALTQHKVPRWLTEGLAVLEERHARPGWGDDLQPGFIAAFKQDKLVPVSKLNNGFVRPSYPQQVVFSYYQASLVAELIERDHGFQTILDMLAAYGAGKTNEQVFRTVLKTEPEAFDKKFDAFMRQKYVKQLAVIGKGEEDSSGLASQLAEAHALIKDKNFDGAIPLLESAKASFPEYAGPDGPYRLLASIYLQKGDKQKAAAELEKHTAINESDYDANVELAGLYEALGNLAAAAAALDRAMYIFPLQPPAHAKLADLYTKLANKQGVVRERRAIVALQPADRAEALYQLALAYSEAGQPAEAKREVLKALEVAPNYEKAQELLLRLRAGSGTDGGSMN